MNQFNVIISLARNRAEQYDDYDNKINNNN